MVASVEHSLPDRIIEMETRFGYLGLRMAVGCRGSGRGGWMDMFVVVEVPVSILGWWIQEPTYVHGTMAQTSTHPVCQHQAPGFTLAF